MYKGLSVLPVSFFKDIESGKISITDWASMAKSIGISYIDIPYWAIRNHNPIYLCRLMKELELLGVSLGMIGTYSDFTNPDFMQRERELEYLKYDIALASQLGAGYLRITDGQKHPGVQKEQGIEWILEYFEKAEKAAEYFGLQLAFENHGHPGSWIFDDFSHSVDVFLEIAERIKGSRIGINFDNANATGCGVDAVTLLDKIYEQVVSVHLSDTSSNSTTVHTAVGSGVSPLMEVIAYLKKRDYRGWCSIEEDSGNGMDGIYQSVSCITQMWNMA